MKKVKFKNWSCNIERAYYGNGRTALELVDEDGDPITVATVNIPEVPQSRDEVFIKDWSENEGMVEALVAAEVISEPIGEVPTGFVTAKVCKLLI